MTLPSERIAYERTAESCDNDLSEWIRTTLNAEVARIAARDAEYEAADRHLDMLVATVPEKKKPRTKR